MSGRELDNVSVATIQDVKLQRFAPLLFNSGPNPLKKRCNWAIEKDGVCEKILKYQG